MSVSRSMSKERSKRCSVFKAAFTQAISFPCNVSLCSFIDQKSGGSARHSATGVVLPLLFHVESNYIKMWRKKMYIHLHGEALL